jgi:hypothetical protein
MTSQTGNDVTSRFVDHAILSVFNTCFVSIVCSSQAVCDFREVNNGRLSISAARGRRKSEVTSPFKRLTTFPICVPYTLRVLDTPFESYSQVFDCRLWRKFDFDRLVANRE